MKVIGDDWSVVKDSLNKIEAKFSPYASGEGRGLRS